MDLTVRLWNKCRFTLWRAQTRLYCRLAPITKRFPKSRKDTGRGKTLYLTFDDGPGAYTRQLLDILRRYHVKATFFVTTGAGHLHLLPEIAAAGHTLGNHTASHNCAALYAEEAAFLQALEQMEQIILEKTGQRATLLRFPGGSISIDYHARQEGMSRKLISLAQSRGYRCVDWDIDSGDTGKARSPRAVLRNIQKALRAGEGPVILLHDIKKHSVEAVERLLVWGLKNGYTFLPLE